jgi:hypothetical protein
MIRRPVGVLLACTLLLYFIQGFIERDRRDREYMIFSEPESVAAFVLKNLGVEEAHVRRHVEFSDDGADIASEGNTP